MAAITNDQILDAIGAMKITEIAELISAMEERFGVTAAAPVAAAGAAPRPPPPRSRPSSP